MTCLLCLSSLVRCAAQEGDVDVDLIAFFLTASKSVLANMISVISDVDDERVSPTIMLQSLDYLLNHGIQHSLRAEPQW